MTAHASTIDMPSFLDDKPKQMLIGGKWVSAVSGKSFPSINPSTGATIATLAEGDAADIDLAVAAARQAFSGPWRKFTPQQRQNLLLKLADLVDQHFDEMHLLDVLDMGVPISMSGGPAWFSEVLRYYAGWATKIEGETVAGRGEGPPPGGRDQHRGGVGEQLRELRPGHALWWQQNERLGQGAQPPLHR
jgi:aldehyde dehydrogenase (NAD+)